MQSTARQLPAHRVSVHQDTVHLQRHLAALLAQQVPRQRLQSVRHRGPLQSARAADQRGLRVAAISARHHVSLSDTLPRRQHPRLRRPVRSAHQSIQREDFHFHLVLAHLRRHRLRVRPARLALVLAASQPRQFPQKVPQTHGSHQSREIRQKTVHSFRGEVSATRRRACLTTHRKKL